MHQNSCRKSKVHSWSACSSLFEKLCPISFGSNRYKECCKHVRAFLSYCGQVYFERDYFAAQLTVAQLNPFHIKLLIMCTTFNYQHVYNCSPLLHGSQNMLGSRFAFFKRAPENRIMALHWLNRKRMA